MPMHSTSIWMVLLIKSFWRVCMNRVSIWFFIRSSSFLISSFFFCCWWFSILNIIIFLLSHHIQDYPLLVGRALFTASRFPKFLSQETLETLLKVTANALHDNQNQIIRVSAMKSIFWLVSEIFFFYIWYDSYWID